MIHRGEFLRPGMFAASNLSESGIAAGISRLGRQLLKQLLGNPFCIALNGYFNPLGKTDPVSIDVHLDQAGFLRPIIGSVARQGGERIQPCAKCQHYIRLRNEFHCRLGSVVAQRTGRQRVGSWKGIVMLIVATYRRAEFFCKRGGRFDGTA